MLAGIIQKVGRVNKVHIFQKKHRVFNAHPPLVRAAAEKATKSGFKKQHTFHVTFSQEKDLLVYLSPDNKLWFDDEKLDVRKNLPKFLSSKFLFNC